VSCCVLRPVDGTTEVTTAESSYSYFFLLFVCLLACDAASYKRPLSSDSVSVAMSLRQLQHDRLSLYQLTAARLVL